MAVAKRKLRGAGLARGRDLPRWLPDEAPAQPDDEPNYRPMDDDGDQALLGLYLDDGWPEWSLFDPIAEAE